jgi:hypothetical protein
MKPRNVEELIVHMRELKVHLVDNNLVSGDTSTVSYPCGIVGHRPDKVTEYLLKSSTQDLVEFAEQCKYPKILLWYLSHVEPKAVIWFRDRIRSRFAEYAKEVASSYVWDTEVVADRATEVAWKGYSDYLFDTVLQTAMAAHLEVVNFYRTPAAREQDCQRKDLIHAWKCHFNEV